MCCSSHINNVHVWFHSAFYLNLYLAHLFLLSSQCWHLREQNCSLLVANMSMACSTMNKIRLIWRVSFLCLEQMMPVSTSTPVSTWVVPCISVQSIKSVLALQVRTCSVLVTDLSTASETIKRHDAVDDLTCVTLGSRVWTFVCPYKYYNEVNSAFILGRVEIAELLNTLLTYASNCVIISKLICFLSHNHCRLMFAPLDLFLARLPA